ncbi:Phage integrase [Paenibacillus algicola]|uniref:Phage integrase n=1 Tax=Paenibacillus algicola TaxID=2565926 RepID=A0A4P8XJ90_9BACL|nr:site-specific integrase [Paenibacillus algicola]QCT02697.1 Phage integrase [Paenibacillus algicola]
MANFKKHKTGWEFRLKYKDPFTQSIKEKSQRGFSTKKEAQLAADEFEKKLLEGYEQTDDVSLASFLEAWLNEYKAGTVRKNTFKLHQNNINNHILKYFQKINLKDIKPIMYQMFLNSLADKNYSKRTVELVHSTMHNAMEKAVYLQKIRKNPCNGVTIKGHRSKSNVQFIESSDIPNFLSAARQYGYIYWIFYKLLIETGMRKGEAAALQWPDIDFKNQAISISKTLDFSTDNRSELFGDPKTFNSKRTIRMSNTLVSDLKYHMTYQNQNKLALKELYRHDLNLVLCRDNGEIMPKSSLFNSFSRILKKVGLPSMPIHALRHTHAVLMLEAGVEMKYIQERLGHGSIQITSDIYAHISKKIEQDSIKKFEEKINFGGIWGADTPK